LKNNLFTNVHTTTPSTVHLLAGLSYVPSCKISKINYNIGLLLKNSFIRLQFLIGFWLILQAKTVMNEDNIMTSHIANNRIL